MNAYSELHKEFLNQRHLFQLGGLITELPNPRTENLSYLCQSDLAQACRVFRDVEIDALKILLDREEVARDLVLSLRKSIDQGGRVFFVGCGATGRLALLLESLWRKQAPRPLVDSVIAFTAGGDYALVRSLGVFEDRQDLGGRHLESLGFRDGDLLIALTEGGETPFVLGALERATSLSLIKPWLLFCNPAKLLAQTATRSKLALENPNVIWHDFQIEPMALTGSTRLQACSVLMAFVGACLDELLTRANPKWAFTDILDRLYQIDPSLLVPLIESEAATHNLEADSGFTLHRSRSAAIAVLTDTTERAPTFSLAPFETYLESDKVLPAALRSRTYLEIPKTKSSQEAWQTMLGRTARPFAAPSDVVLPDGTKPLIDLNQIHGFDFSESVIQRRKHLKVSTSLVIDVEFEGASNLAFRTRNPETGNSPWEASFFVGSNAIVQQSVLKYLLNLQSTLAMGRLKRFHGNLMTFVKPTNGKLIDRTLRTVRNLLGHIQTTPSERALNSLPDEELIRAIFTAMAAAGPSEAVALKAVEILRFDRSSHKR